MDEKFLAENKIDGAVRRFQNIMEYVNLGGGIRDDVNEAGDEAEPAPVPSMGGAPDPAMGGAPDPSMGGAPDPSMGGAPDPAMGGAPDPSMGGAPDPSAGGAPDPSMGGDPNAGGVEGFDPSMGGAPDPAMGGAPESEGEDGSEDEVIDVDELVDSQEDTEKKLSKMSKKFDKLIDRLSSLEKSLDMNSENMEGIKREIEKRNPTPVEKLSLRSRMSGPYDQSVDEYWDEKEATSPNYSTEDDNNGEDDQIYKITKADIDDDVNWQAISKSLDDGSLKPMGLRDILGM